MPSSEYITPEMVRSYLLDRSMEDNQLLMDLAYTDAEILFGMQGAAREYNSIPPLVSRVDAAHLSATTNMFLDGVVYQLLLAELTKLMRNDFDYSAGGVTTSIQAKQIAHIKELLPVYRDRFVKAVTDWKVYINIQSAYGHF